MSSLIRQFGQIQSPYFTAPGGGLDGIGNLLPNAAIGFLPGAVSATLLGGEYGGSSWAPTEATFSNNTYTFPTYELMIVGLKNLVIDWYYDYTCAVGESLRDIGKVIYITYKGQSTPSITMRLLRPMGSGDENNLYFTTSSSNGITINTSVNSVDKGQIGNANVIRS